MFNRVDGRSHRKIRNISFQADPFGYSDGSVFFQQGNTKVYVSVSLEAGVPKFLKGTGKGWITAEYAMHPNASDKGRMQRESSMANRNFRSIEISRLIGRCLRSVVNLNKLGERNIFVDCDVLQSDGGTRTACITAAGMALALAQKQWLAKGLLKQPIIEHEIAAVSVGIYQGCSLVDLDCKEDNACVTDFNFVMTRSGMIVEIQGTAEAYPVSWPLFEELKILACDAILQVFAALEKNI